MSRVLNVAIAELNAAHLPPICAATGHTPANAAETITAAEITLTKIDWPWFPVAVCTGPAFFWMADLLLERHRLRLPLEPAARAAQAERARRNFRWLRLGQIGWLVFLSIVLLWLKLPGAALCLCLGAAGWAFGLIGTWRICQESQHLPALLETFRNGRVAIELPSWWVADEYRRALGHPLQGEPKAVNDQEAEDALWEARGKKADWDNAPPAAPVPPAQAPPPVPPSTP